ncbi:hypothetical protein TD95_004444 [Thielaviopsis punctulata]|uniref:DUF7918 domain-containing protein n=1 Tax=Thielaviopsis punctulata TaxID=72032 RepID=A0A0F4ZB74_9PEZI|nr:hypothetical protein TD95_004444 [Thielaviopsis punctulata]
MPCFKGIAVSIHANGSPVPEHGLQKQSRFSRISTYIPVPQPTLAPGSTKPEPARFAISITLLTPGLAIPYSTPKPTPACPKPKPQFVGPVPGLAGESKPASGVSPYIPVTSSPNETIAAYIYFDGRAKEEVATLLRPGEETWVNSRWVHVPESEGGGLAEREFLFREVGLERWLNGLDLKGHDAAEKLQRRRQKFEARRKREDSRHNGGANDHRDTLRYGADETAPLEAVMADDLSTSDDDEPPEATGQIKVAMFRVLASGEIKKGEYSPQYDAHDDDEEGDSNQSGVEADVEHTTSFAKPKSLDPNTISTQTVTGIDGPDKPYAIFTFFYRGERQLQKIGIIGSKPVPETATASKRRSGQLDFGTLGPLKTTGTVGFSAFRESNNDPSRRRKSRKNDNGVSINDDSDEDDDDDSPILGTMDDADDKNPTIISDDPNFGGELTDGVNRIRLKRALSTEPDRPNRSNTTAVSKGLSIDASHASNAQSLTTTTTSSTLLQDGNGFVGSPLKKHRPSEQASAMASSLFTASADLASVTGMDAVISESRKTNKFPPSATSTGPPATATHMEEEEEL